MADLQFTGQHYLLGELLRALNSLQQKARRSGAKLIPGLVYRGKRRSGKLSKIEVVKSDNGELVGTVKIQLTGRQQDANRHQIITGKDRSRPGQHTQQSRRRHRRIASAIMRRSFLAKGAQCGPGDL